MEVKVKFYKGEAIKIFNNIINVYSKDDMLCLEDDDKITKIPLMHVLYVKHKHGNHIGASNDNKNVIVNIDFLNKIKHCLNKGEDCSFIFDEIDRITDNSND